MCVTERHRRTTSAEPQQLAIVAFLKLLVLAVIVHLRRSPQVIEGSVKNIANLAFEAAAGHHITIG